MESLVNEVFLDVRNGEGVLRPHEEPKGIRVPRAISRTLLIERCERNQEIGRPVVFPESVIKRKE